MHLRVRMTVERNSATRPEAVAERIERVPAGVGQHQIVIREAARADIGGPRFALKVRQGHGRIEIVEHAHGP